MSNKANARGADRLFATTSAHPAGRYPVDNMGLAFDGVDKDENVKLRSGTAARV